MPVYTLGHSTHAAPTFIELADRFQIECIIDVRSHPTSRWHWFRRESMQRWLPAHGIGYEWWPELGGWTAEHMDRQEWAAERGVDVAAYSRGAFPKQRIGVPRNDPTLFEGEEPPRWVSGWRNQGLHDYAWFTALPEFQRGVERLHDEKRRVAIVCAEVLWWKCHRSMISDVLTYRWLDPVYHIMPPNKLQIHNGGRRYPAYPADVKSAWTS